MRAPAVRVAGPADAEAVGRLLHDFNSEYDEPTPGPERLAERIRLLLAGGDTTVLLGGTGAEGVAGLPFPAASWGDAPEAHLAGRLQGPANPGRMAGCGPM